jgi:hypothetical protein
LSLAYTSGRGNDERTAKLAIAGCGYAWRAILTIEAVKNEYTQ